MSKRKVVIVSAALISVVLISLVFYFTLTGQRRQRKNKR